MNFRLFLETIDLSHIDPNQIVKWVIEYMDWSSDSNEFQLYAKQELYGDYYYDEDDLDEDKVDKRAQEIAKDKLEDELYEVMWQYERFQDPLRLYREITVHGDTFDEIIKNIRMMGIGIYWTHSENAAQAHWGKFDKGYRKVLLYAEIPSTSVDWEGTLIQNITPNMADEKETRVFEGSQITVKKLKIDDKWYDYTLGAFA